jgi:hypothetical protein
MPPRDILGFFGRLPRAATESGGGPADAGSNLLLVPESNS